jgi:hypothetical protein
MRTEASKLANRIYRAKRIAMLRDKELCRNCGKPLNLMWNNTTCAKCRVKDQRRKLKLERKRRKNGLCSACNEPAAGGKSRCARHHELHLQAGRKYMRKKRRCQDGNSPKASCTKGTASK